MLKMQSFFEKSYPVPTQEVVARLLHFKVKARGRAEGDDEGKFASSSGSSIIRRHVARWLLYASNERKSMTGIG